MDILLIFSPDVIYPKEKVKFNGFIYDFANF